MIFHQAGLKYPLRRDRAVNSTKTIPIPVVQAIEHDLAYGSDSIRTISDKYSVPVSTIQNINNGYILKYKDPNKQYPLRDNRYRNNPVTTSDV